MEPANATADLQRELIAAYELLKRGRASEAESVCRHVLGRAPREAAAVHLLGLIRKDAGDAADGERLIRASIELDPRRAEYRANLANLLRRAGHFRDAEASRSTRPGSACEARSASVHARRPEIRA